MQEPEDPHAGRRSKKYFAVCNEGLCIYFAIDGQRTQETKGCRIDVCDCQSRLCEILSGACLVIPRGDDVCSGGGRNRRSRDRQSRRTARRAAGGVADDDGKYGAIIRKALRWCRVT